MLIDIKLINTILSGCEYTINKENVFIIVNQKWLTQNDGLVIPNDGILIPTDEDTPCNFSIKFPAGNEFEYKIVVHYQDESRSEEEIPLEFNRIYSIGSVQFVAKTPDTSWNYEITQPPCEAGFVGQLALTTKLSFLQRIQRKYIPYFLIGLIGIGALGLGWYSYTEAERRVHQVSELFSNNINVRVILGPDDKVYVFAKDNKSMQLVFEVLKNNPMESSDLLKIKNIVSEKGAIGMWLTKYWPNLKWNMLNLDDLEHPILFLSQQRDKPFTAESKKQFIHDFQSFVPYTKTVSFSYLDDTILVSQAKYGLKQLNVEYRQEINPSYNTFIIQGELDDSDLLRLKQFVSEFYRTWGDNYIRFVITLHRDFLKNFSFKNGPQNYIKISNNHWYIKI